MELMGGMEARTTVFEIECGVRNRALGELLLPSFLPSSPCPISRGSLASPSQFSKQVEAYDDGVALRAPVFPCDEIETLFEAAIQSAGGPADRKALENNLVAVRATVRAHAAGLAAYEGAVVRGILARFVATEDAFQTEDDHVLEALNARHGGDLQVRQTPCGAARARFSKACAFTTWRALARTAASKRGASLATRSQAIHAAYLSHANLPRKAALVRVLLSTFACKDPGPYRPLLRRIATMSGPTLVDLSTLARTLHDHSNLLDLRRGVWRALHAVIAPDSHGEAAGSSGPSKLAARRSTMTDGVFDGLGPLAMRPLRRASTQPDAEWAVSRRLTQNEPSRFSLDPAVAGGAASTCVTDTVAVPGMAPEDVCEDLISAQAAVDEALASLAGADALGRLAMTTFVRRMYHTFLTSGPEEVPDTASQGIPACTWSFTGLPSAGNSTGATERGFLAVVSSAADVEKAAAVAQAVLGAGGEATVHLIVTEPRQEPQEADAQCNGHLLSEKPKQHAITGTGDVPHAVVAAAQACMTPLHETAGVTCVSLCSPGGAHGLSSVTLRWAGAVGTLSPDDAQGATPAPLGRILEVARAPRDARSAVSRNMQILLLSSAERPRPNSKPVVRAFVRGVVRSVPQHAALDLSSDTLGPQDSSFEPKGSTGGPLSAAMDAVASCKRQLKVALTELAVREFPSAAGKTQKASWAHVFLSVLPPTPLPDPTADLQGAEGAVSAVRSACVRLVAALSRDVQRASVAEIEMRLRSSCPGVEAWRVLVHTPTGTVASEDDIEVRLLCEKHFCVVCLVGGQTCLEPASALLPLRTWPNAPL